LFSSYDVIDSFIKWKPPIFFLDSDSPFNFLNDSVKILLSYIRKLLKKKKIKSEKINFITNENKSKNQVGKSNSQMLLSISFVCVFCFTKRAGIKLNKTKQGEFLHKHAYCQQAGASQFEHLIP
jgi:hypothetical protein